MAKPVARDYFDAVGNSNVGVSCPEPTRAVQSAKADCDINTIVSKYLRTGELPNARQEAYLDLIAVPSYHDALNGVILAEEAFMALPAEVRTAFDNDPAKLIAEASDVKNRAKFIKLGLISPPAGLPPPVASGQDAPGGVPASPKPDSSGPN